MREYLLGLATIPVLWILWEWILGMKSTIEDTSVKVIDWPEDREPWRRFYAGGQTVAVSIRRPRTLVVSLPLGMDWALWCVLAAPPIVMAVVAWVVNGRG